MFHPLDPICCYTARASFFLRTACRLFRAAFRLHPFSSPSCRTVNWTGLEEEGRENLRAKKHTRHYCLQVDLESLAEGAVELDGNLGLSLLFGAGGGSVSPLEGIGVCAP